MLNFDAYWTRRRFLSKVTAGVAAAYAFNAWAPGAFAEALTRTPAQTEGPFYPDKLPLDTDNDLLIVNDTITPAVGEVTHMTGRILDASGSPVRTRRSSRILPFTATVQVTSSAPSDERPQRSDARAGSFSA